MRFPAEGDLVVGTITRVEDYGFYAALDEYGNLEGFVPSKEIPSNVARNLASYFKPKQKVILKVIYSNPQRLQVDLSLRRVTNDERRKKLLQYKQEVMASKILDLAKSKAGLKDDSKFREALREAYGSLYSALVSLVENLEGGLEVLKKVKDADRKVAEAYARAAAEIAAEKIRPKKVAVGGIVKAYSTEPNGIAVVKEAFMKAAEGARKGGVELMITYAGAPRYLVRVIADDYRAAEGALSTFIELAEKGLKGKGAFEFERAKK